MIELSFIMLPLHKTIEEICDLIAFPLSLNLYWNFGIGGINAKQLWKFSYQNVALNY